MDLKKGLCALLGTVALTSCRNEITEGEIYEKFSEPERSWFERNGFFSSFLLDANTLYFHYDDEDFFIRIRGYNAEHNQTRTLLLERQAWERVNVGYYFLISEYRGIQTEDPLEYRRATEQEEWEHLGR